MKDGNLNPKLLKTKQILSVLGDVIALLCGLNATISFIEACFWHLTEPKTLGFKLLPVVYLVTCLVAPSLLSLVKCCKKFDFVTARVCLKNFRIIWLLIEPLLLFISSLPCLDDKASYRTVVLGIATFLFPSVIRNKIKENIAVKLLVVLYITFCSRWTSHSVNIFYEEWRLNAVLLISVVIGCITEVLVNIKINEKLESRNNIKSNSTFDEEELVKERSITLQTNISKHGRDENLLEEASNSCDHCKKDEIKNSIKTESSLSLTSQTSNQTVNSQNNDATNSNRGSNFKVILLAPGIASYLMFFCQFCSSPNQLLRWSGFERSKLIFTVIYFTIMSFLVLFLNSKSKKFKPLKTDEANQTETYLNIKAVQRSVTSLICFSCVTIATILALNSLKSESIVIIAATLPISIYILVDYYVIASNNGGNFPKAVSHFIGATFFVAYLISCISFSLNQVTSFFFARIDYVIILMALSIFLSLATVAFCEGKKAITEVNQQQVEKPSKGRKGQHFILFVVMVTVLLIAFMTSQFNVSPLTCRKNCTVSTNHLREIPENGTLRLMTWNLLLGHTFTGRDNSACVDKVIKNLGADVVGLQESDPLSVFWGGKDVLGSIEAQTSGYQSLDGVNPVKSTLGVGVLSKLRVLTHENSLLSEEKGVLLPHYGFTKTNFDVGLEKRNLYVINVHSVYKNWTAVRKTGGLTRLSRVHMEAIARVANSSVGRHGNPVVVMGDFNLNPYEAEMDVLLDTGFKFSLHGNRKIRGPSTLLNRVAYVDHIFYRNLNFVKSFVVDEIGDISDHYPVVADFIIE